jgi:type IV secretory pathway TrbL component
MKTGRCLVLNYFSIFSKPYTITFSNFDQTIPVPESSFILKFKESFAILSLTNTLTPALLKNLVLVLWFNLLVLLLRPCPPYR